LKRVLTRIFGSDKPNVKQIVCCVLIATLIVALFSTAFPQFFFPRTHEAHQPVTITAQGLPSANNPDNHTEAWILDIIANGLTLDLADIDVPDSWDLRQGYDYTNLISYRDQPSAITIMLPPGQHQIDFLSHAWSGLALVETLDGVIEVDLFDEYARRVAYHISIYPASIFQSYSLIELALRFTIFLALLTVFLYICAIKKRLFFATHLLFSVGFFINLLAIDQANITRVLVLSVPVVFMFFYYCKPQPEFMEKYKSKPIIALVVAVQLYFTFAVVARNLFMLTPRFTFTENNLALFCILFVALFPYCFAFIYGMEKIRHFSKERIEVEDRSKIIKVRSICFGITFVILFLFSLGYYPAIMTPDGAGSHWPRALGLDPITTNHPPFFQIFVKLTAQIATTPYVYVLSQILAFSAITASFLAFFYKKGIRAHVAFILAGFVALLPNNYMMLFLLSSSPFSAVINLWVLYLLIRLIDDLSWFCSKWYMLASLSLALAFLGLSRQNTIFAIYVVGIIIIFLTIRYFSKVKAFLLISFACVFAIMQLIQGPVFDAVGVVRPESPTGAVPIVLGPLITPLATAMQLGVDLPDDIIDLADRMLPRNEWNRHVPSNSDRLSWGYPRLDLSNVEQSEIFDMYFRLLTYYPDIVIKDRLDGTDSLWSVFSGIHLSPYTKGISIVIDPSILPTHLQNVEPGNYEWFVSNSFTVLPDKIARTSFAHQLSDILFWRTGTSVILLLYVLVFLFVRKEQILLTAILPSFIIFCTLMLVVGWQIYQYQWFFPLAVTFFLLYCVAVRPDKDIDPSNSN